MLSLLRMRTLFIPCRSTTKVEIDDAVLRKLPERIAVVSTVQHLHEIDAVRQRLRELGKSVLDLEGSHSTHKNQVLGCTTFPEKQLKDIDAILYIGTGEFHPKALALRTGKAIHIYNPHSKTHSMLDDKEVEKLRKKERAALAAFLSATRIGILFTTKPGQSQVQFSLDRVRELERKYPDKEFYCFLDNVFEPAKLENFPFIECFLNTACPNIPFDEGFPRPVLNIESLFSL